MADQRTSFFDEISKNNLKSFLLLFLFGAFFVLIIYALVVIFGGGLFAIAIGIAIVAIYAIIVYTMGDRAVLALSGAKPADKKQYPVLYDIVDGLATANQIPVPKVYVINDQNPNAFATGRSRKASSIAVTTGLLNMMNRSELEGVIAHETSHILDSDIKVMMIAIIFAGAIGIIAAILRNAIFFGGVGGNRNAGVLILVALAIGVLAPILALLIRLAISRRREYMADANGARIIRDPDALASALTKIMNYEKNPQSAPMKNANEITANMYFATPFKVSSAWNWFSTHPPIEERIKRLKNMY